LTVCDGKDVGPRLNGFNAFRLLQQKGEREPGKPPEKPTRPFCCLQAPVGARVASPQSQPNAGRPEYRLAEERPRHPRGWPASGGKAYISGVYVFGSEDRMLPHSQRASAQSDRSPSILQVAAPCATSCPQQHKNVTFSPGRGFPSAEISIINRESTKNIGDKMGQNSDKVKNGDCHAALFDLSERNTEKARARLAKTSDRRNHRPGRRIRVARKARGLLMGTASPGPGPLTH